MEGAGRGRQPAARDHDDGVAGRARQQLGDVGGALVVGGVVEHDKQPGAVGQRAVGGRRLVGVARHVVAVHAQRHQQVCQRRPGVERTGRVVAAQVEVDLPVGEVRRHRVTDAQRERRLADAGHARDADHLRGQAGRLAQPVGHRAHQVVAADVQRRRRGQLRGAQRPPGAHLVGAGPGLADPAPAAHLAHPPRVVLVEPEPAHEGVDRAGARAFPPAALQHADALDAQAAALGQLLLREAAREP
ncbi:hypothetical protein GCM10025872_03400 [Barrientosiimonas endolithica]|uniref:Uncharacterized protein n=1 Tax=Barrientosiimonas endolithica TaxID=1535208 RepID=A0ABM8H750_9MICO|nr:hypothetical protein GCM10025872_03400 [Barrientosiimonas endolithica]